MVSEMFLAGAKGFVLKDSAFDELTRAVNAVYTDRTYVSPDVAGDLINRQIRHAAPGEQISAESKVPTPRLPSTPLPQWRQALRAACHQWPDVIHAGSCAASSPLVTPTNLLVPPNDVAYISERLTGCWPARSSSRWSARYSRLLCCLTYPSRVLNAREDVEAALRARARRGGAPAHGRRRLVRY